MKKRVAVKSHRRRDGSVVRGHAREVDAAPSEARANELRGAVPPAISASSGFSEIPLSGDYVRNYYEGTERKHFSEGAGSQFTEAKNLNHLLQIAKDERAEGLEGDDRDEFIAMGCNPASFREGMRYLMVETPGKLGSSDTTKLSDDTVLEPIQKHGKDEYRFAAVVDEKEHTDVSTIIMMDNPTEESTGEGIWNDIKDNPPESLLLTAYPGVPGGYRGAVRDEEAKAWLANRLKDPTPLTVGEVKKHCWGGKDFGVNLKVR